MSDAATLERLVAVVERLEAISTRLESAPASGGSGGSAPETKEKSPRVIEFEAYLKDVVAPFVKTCSEVKDANKVGPMVDTAFKFCGVAVAATAECKKPSQNELMEFLKPIVDIVKQSDSMGDNRSSAFPYEKAFMEGILAMNWFFMSPTKPYIISCLEAGDFYLNKILKAAKDMGDEDKAASRNYVKQWKDVLNGLANFCFAHFKAGPEWNGRGIPLKDFNPAGAAPAAAIPSPPGGIPLPPPGIPVAPSAPTPSAPKSSSSSSGGMASVFAEINKGLSVTSGLKKVDRKQMTHKNPELRKAPGLKPKERKKSPVAKPATTQRKKEPKKHMARGTYYIEHFDGETIEVGEAEGIDQKKNVYILKPRNCTIIIKGRCKAISIDGAFKTRVYFDTVVSLVEIFNSQRTHVLCNERVPSFQIDKSSGVSVELATEVAASSPPDIITSNISECNFLYPSDPDPIEVPLPEQYITKWTPGTSKLDTNPITHGG